MTKRAITITQSQLIQSLTLRDPKISPERAIADALASVAFHCRSEHTTLIHLPNGRILKVTLE